MEKIVFIAVKTRSKIDYFLLPIYIEGTMSDNNLSKIVRFIDYYDTVDITICTCGHQFADKKVDGPYEPEFSVLQYVTEGKGYLELGGKTYEIVQGDLFFLPEGHTCKYYADEKDPYAYYWVAFQGKYAEHLLKKCNITSDDPVMHVNNKQAERQFELMFKDMRQHKLPAILMVLSHLYCLFSILIKITSANRTYTGHYLIEEAMLYMDHHYCEPITVKDVCTYLNCDISHFIKVFKRHQGLSPKEYLDSLKLTRAKQLLKENRLTITQIASSLGFDDYSAFYKWFKKESGRSPRKYRSEKLINNRQREVQTTKGSQDGQ